MDHLQGHGLATIVTEAGYDSSGQDTWFDLMCPVAEVSRVCAYDRAGTGTQRRAAQVSGEIAPYRDYYGDDPEGDLGRRRHEDRHRENRTPATRNGAGLR